MDIYRSAKRRGKYPTLATDTEVNIVVVLVCEIIYTKKYNLHDFFTSHGCKPGRHFLSNCSVVSSTGYSEFDKPISVYLQHYPLFFEYILICANYTLLHVALKTTKLTGPSCLKCV